MRRLTLLGATGSIGASTLDIVRRHRARYSIHALTADTRVEAMHDLCREFEPAFAVMRDAPSAGRLADSLAGGPTRVLDGESGLCEVAAAAEVDTVVAGIVGAGGLLPTLAAVSAGKRVLLANKEALVMAGELFMRELSRHGAELLPLDSEHNAIFQCLPPATIGQGIDAAGVERIILTGSGGPFRDLEIDALEDVTPAQACNHPNWDMGPKISVDSATMMNKGLEMIEACWLFAVDQSVIDIVLHRQSIVHSMVAYRDGSVIAQLGNPDMRTPIANALAWPERIESGVEPLDLLRVGSLDFMPADERRYPCLALAREAWHQGGTAPAILNAANEVAVAAFLDGRIRFTDIARVIEAVIEQGRSEPAASLDAILDADDKARKLAREQLSEQV